MTTSQHRAMPMAAPLVPQPSSAEADSARTPVARPFVFVTVGTDHHPFDRLVQWVDVWAAAHPEIEVVIQYGEACSPAHADPKAYLTHSERAEPRWEALE